jgi:hypothetical protein
MHRRTSQKDNPEEGVKVKELASVPRRLGAGVYGTSGGTDMVTVTMPIEKYEEMEEKIKSLTEYKNLLIYIRRYHLDDLNFASDSAGRWASNVMAKLMYESANGQ